MVFVWGFHFIVMKGAFEDLAPLTFNALRYLVGLPLMMLIAVRQKGILDVSRRDAALLVITTLFGSFAYQVLLTLGLDRTTATNTALLVATMPVWAALFSLALRLTEVRQQLFLGMVMALGGVALVVLGKEGANLSLSRDDLIGSTLVLAAAIANGASNVFTKPLADRMGGIQLGIWKYCLTMTGMVLVAAPDLFTLSPSDVPLHSVPNILYSGILSGVGGYIFMNYALREIGPTRTTSYFNFNPIVATFAGIVFLGELLTLGLIVGGPLALFGVMVVRRNTFLRPLSDPAAGPVVVKNPVHTS